jgi:hypothetical protein
MDIGGIDVATQYAVDNIRIIGIGFIVVVALIFIWSLCKISSKD